MKGDKLRTCTIRELIEALQDAEQTHGPKAQVVFACDYGDFHHTKQVVGLDGDVDEEEILPSAYSQSGWAVVDEAQREADRQDEKFDGGEFSGPARDRDRQTILVIY